ncbi:hypothetical protein [Micromonospora sp. RTP1Z1]|uniref:hypothetical protein n=1 Tax=Micromonospora sp. RTP1Z1 TaxID=2994043 RepID=UPI0029C61F7F|nr:hypothetical protein [Micromonospora sp. RTP1Z1]
MAGDALPFDWPTAAARTPVDRLVDANLALLEVLLLTALAYWLTRRRTLPNLADRAPERSAAARETLLLLLYGAGGLGLGFVLARLAGWHPFGLHLAGSIYGTHEHVSPAESIAWAAYNLVVYAVVPLLFFRRRYSAEALSLRSSNRRADAVLIGVILVIESVVQIAALDPQIFDLTAGQLILGLPLTLTLYLAGAVLPAMIFIYAILVPRFLRLTGSTATTVILGGLTYTALHVWDAWTVFNSPRNAALSIVFLLLTYFAPGMFKTVLTVRTGNAWVHVWAYHALAPHTLADTPHMVHVFHLR